MYLWRVWQVTILVPLARLVLIHRTNGQIGYNSSTGYLTEYID